MKKKKKRKIYNLLLTNERRILSGLMFVKFICGFKIVNNMYKKKNYLSCLRIESIVRSTLLSLPFYLKRGT